MKSSHRSYREERGDLRAMMRLCSSLTSTHPPRGPWHVPRLIDWRYNQSYMHPEAPEFCRENAELWFDDFGELVAFAVSECGRGDFAIHALPGWSWLFEPIFEWALGAWGGRGGARTTEIAETQGRERAILERRGFARSGESRVNVFDLERWERREPALEPGYAIVDMGEGADLMGQALLRLDAFHGADQASAERAREQEAARMALREAPYYHPWTDLCVRAPDGSYVAGCEALYDPSNSYAEIERVCTRSGYRRRGFARASIVECLNRLAAMGIGTATIAGYDEGTKALYGSLGHVSAYSVWVMERRD
jgi:ribosomal protein S18 acetylase RimI-like enzyme